MVGAVRDLLLSANHLIFSAKTRRQISLRCTSIRAQKKAPVLQALKGKSGKSLKGRKVPPKYRSPSGETWAGRGPGPGSFLIKDDETETANLLVKSMSLRSESRRLKADIWDPTWDSRCLIGGVLIAVERCLSELWLNWDGQRRYSEANVPLRPARPTIQRVPPDQLTRGLRSSRLPQLQEHTNHQGASAFDGVPRLRSGGVLAENSM